MKAGESVRQVRLVVLDPGHFHAALVQANMYEQVSPDVYVYGPAGPDIEDYKASIRRFNQRPQNPTSWQLHIYTGDDFLTKAFAEKRGDVVVLAGNNSKKVDYITAAVESGHHVLADKPMCINPAEFQKLEQAFGNARKKGLLIFDIMTERFEITSLLQKELVNNLSLAGPVQRGTAQNPSIIKKSVHHFLKQVAGKTVQRPGWYFDTNQQGEGIIDVTTHLADMAMWMCFPDQAVNYRDIEIIKGHRRPTMIDLAKFEKVTGLNQWPDFLKTQLDKNGVLPCYANGRIDYRLKGIHTQIEVLWQYQAAAGTGDTHYSLVRTENTDIVIRQGAQQNFKPQLYIEPNENTDKQKFQHELRLAIDALKDKYHGISLSQTETAWQILIPDDLRISHEAHFQQVTRTYLRYLAAGKLPDYEVTNMLTKYYTTTSGLKAALS